ncbi:MAG TPA: DUF3309 family protein [Verrucomicrobiae bacterium]|jgi:hypothetical protein|nr:DUF3309 family protein [Verrucomicrobiae bacterium]
MSTSILVLLLLVILLAAVTPTWGYSRKWGYAPSGLVGTILLIVLILMLLGQL